MIPNTIGAQMIPNQPRVKTDVTPRALESRASSTSRSFRRKGSVISTNSLNQQQKVVVQMAKHRLTQSNSVGTISDRSNNRAKVQSATPKPSLQPSEGQNSNLPQQKQLAPILDPCGPNVQSEYISMGRQMEFSTPQGNQEIDARDGLQTQTRFLYDKTKQGSMFGAAKPEHRHSVNSKGSNNETSDDYNQVAEEDHTSYIRVRNAYLDDDIGPDLDQFKQEPKHEKRPNKNPNINLIPQSALNHHPIQSPILAKPNAAIQALAQSSNRRIFDTNSNRGSVRLDQQRPLTQASQALIQALQQRKPSRPFQQTEPQQPQFATKNGRRIVTSTGKLTEALPSDRFRASTQIVVLPVQSKKDDNQSSAKPHPMFQRMLIEEPNNGKKQAMIHQFEMSCGPKNGVAAQVYNNKDFGQSGSTLQGLMNKATLCDSTASQKQNNTTGSNSQFLRKSLWLLTNSKSRSLRDLVAQRQQNCNQCLYIHAYSQLTLANNFGYSSRKNLQNVTKSPMLERQWAKQGVPQETNKIGPIEQKPRENQGHGYKLTGVDGTKSKSLQFQTLPPELSNNLGSIQANSRINLKISSPVSPQSPETESFLSGRRSVRRLNNVQASGSLLSADHYYDANGGLVQHLSSIHNELYDRFEAQYFFFLLKRSLNTKYMTSQEYYNSKVSSDIMYNEQRHIVSVFKEYLIYDDFSEYLKRFYTKKESDDRLPRIFEFYENYSKVFPNYVSLPESKYMFKNIERKQKLIDQRHQNFLKNQKKDARELSESRSSVLVLFNSKFLKEVYDEPTLHNSLAHDPRTELSNLGSSRVLNNPPKLQESLSILNTSRQNRELENIINLLSKFEQDSIMAREVVSDSLLKGQDGPLQVKGVQQKIKLDKLFQDQFKVGRAGPDLSMDSWAHNVYQDQPFMIKQDSEIEMESEIFAQSCDLADGINSKRVTIGVPATLMTMSKPQFEVQHGKKKAEAKAFEFANAKKKQTQAVKEFLDEPIVIAVQDPLIKPVEKKALQYTQSVRGVFTKKISIAEFDQAEPEMLAANKIITRNQDFIPRNQASAQTLHPVILTSGSSLAGTVSKAGVTSAAKVRETMTQKGMPKQTSNPKLIQEEQLSQNSALRFRTLPADSKQSKFPVESIQSNIKNLIKETNKIIKGNSKNRQSEQGSSEKIRTSIQRKSVVQTISRNDCSNSIDNKKSLSFGKKQSGQKVEQFKSEQDRDVADRMVSYGSQTSLGNSQNNAKLKANQQQVKQKKMLEEKIITKRSIQIPDEELRAKYATLTNERKVKTVLEVHEGLDIYKTKGLINKGLIEPKQIVRDSACTTTKIAKNIGSSLGSTQQTRPIVEKKKLIIKNDKQTNSENQFSLTGVYQMIGQASSQLSTNQLTPYALLNYYTGNTDNVVSSNNIPSTLTSPDVKERTSKSESVLKNLNIQSEETYNGLLEKQTPNRVAFKAEKFSSKHLTESATLAAVKYFQTNQVNPYEKTGHLKSTLTNGSDNSSGKSSARGINSVVNSNSIKGRNQMPNSKKLIQVNAAAIVKPGSSLSGTTKPAMPGTVYMTLPRQGGTQGSSLSSNSNNSQKPIAQGTYTQSEASLLALAKKTTALMKKGPLSTGSSGKLKRKHENDQLTSKGVSKLPVKQGQGLAKKVLTGTQGHTIFSVNAKFASNM